MIKFLVGVGKSGSVWVVRILVWVLIYLGWRIESN